MTDIRGNFVTWNPSPIDRANDRGKLRPGSTLGAPPSPSFQQVLDKASPHKDHHEWTISQHAKDRLRQRGISLSSQDLSKMTEMATQAQQKGAKDIYMVMGQTGLVVNLPSRTVVTAMNNQESTIVTQIDSVVFVKGPDHSGGSLPVGERSI